MGGGRGARENTLTAKSNALSEDCESGSEAAEVTHRHSDLMWGFFALYFKGLLISHPASGHERAGLAGGCEKY